MYILIRLDFYQKVDVDSGKIAENRHDFYSKASSREMSRTKCGPLHDLCRPHQRIRHNQSQWALENNDEVWLSTEVYRQIVGIPMDTNFAPLVADLFLFCYERDFMTSLSDDNQADIIEAFKSTSRY